VLQSVFRAELPAEEHCATAANLLRVCGPHFNQAVLPQLLPAAQWLMSVMARIPAVASEALQEICGYAGQHLLPHVQDLLQVVVAVAPKLPAEVDVALHGALAGVVRGLPGDQAMAAFFSQDPRCRRGCGARSWTAGVSSVSLSLAPVYHGHAGRRHGHGPTAANN